MRNNMFGWKKGGHSCRRGQRSTQPAGRLLWAEVLELFAGGGGLTASSVCLCLGSANYLCALAFLRSSSRCFICATGGVIREKEMWCWCANTPLGGWVEKLQSLSQEQLAEEQSQHKMPKAKRLWPNVFDFISAEGLFPLPAAENRQGLRPGAEDCAASYGEFLSTCESFTRDFCSGGWGLITYSV